MKKIFMILSLVMAAIGVNAQNSNKVALQHQGSLSMYDAFYTDSIINKVAVDGDTVFLTEGYFPSFTIQKKVSVIGDGQNTIVGGNISIAPSESSSSTYKPVIEALRITGGGIIVDKSVADCTVSQCRFDSIVFNAPTQNFYVNRCYINNAFFLSDNVKGLHCDNSKVMGVDGKPANYDLVVFNHCNIRYIAASSFQGHLTNSIVSYSGKLSGSTWSNVSTNWSNNAVAVYCQLHSGNFGSSKFCTNQTDCQSSSDDVSSTDLTLFTTMTGSDGTTVGITGGVTPFTLTPSVPQVASKTITVDKANKKLNVTIKLTTE